MHMGWMHLIGNMIFLWAFGLIVEGKVGWMAFSSIYLVIGTLYGLFLQVSSLVVGWDGFALGASAAIFGLLAMCIAWAPANEFTLLWRFGMFDVTVLMYGFFRSQRAVFVHRCGFPNELRTSPYARFRRRTSRRVMDGSNWIR